MLYGIGVVIRWNNHVFRHREVVELTIKQHGGMMGSGTPGTASHNTGSILWTHNYLH